MPKPTAHTASAVRSLRPPAPRPVAQTSTKEQQNKKPVSRTQSQPRPPMTEGGGNVKIPTIKLDFKEKAKPKIDAKSEYVPPVPEKKMISQKLVWNAQSKVGSLDNVKHKPAGGNVQILDQKLEWHAASKVGSMDNIKHKPGGGNVQVIRHFSARNIG
ncbi:Tau and MAP protein, tubulin-binding repeat protein [Teladorsagia circumcincta]|uniref:Microtubule-associated protein n=1 Tax=Teladorsagia circumcincta TaxID=45464 RepID=A0A2G9TIT6_TELCI|nr:Tau and MAP protein, tubulin-binding repeat protein [Teladorsagia circumcincta]